MGSELQIVLEANNSANRGQIVSIIFQTLLYGIYLCLVPIAVHAMVTNGLQSRARKWILAIITSMFALMTVYWILCVVFTLLLVDVWDNIFTACYGSDNPLFCIVHKVQANHMPMGTWMAMFADILLVNYIIADGVVIWRAWALCPDQSRVVLKIPVVALGINTVIYLVTVAARAIQILLASKHEDTHIVIIIGRVINNTQVAHLTMSVLINIFATSIIALKAWKYRKLLMESGIDVRSPRQAFRILAILVESGMIYILIGITSVVSIPILTSFKFAELSTLFMLAAIQLVGIYPIVVILLVEKKSSLNSMCSSYGTITDVRGDRPSQVEPMAFASRSVLASGGEIDLVTKSPHTTIHVTFDHILEPGDVEMGAGNGKVSNQGHAAPY